MNLFTSKMRMLTAVVLEEDGDRVTRELLRQGVLDFVQISSLGEVDTSIIKPHEGEGLKTRLTDLRRRIEGFYLQGELPLPKAAELDVSRLSRTSVNSYEADLDRMDEKVHAGREKQMQINQEILKLQELERYLGSSPETQGSEFLLIFAGNVGRGSLNELEKRMEGMPSFLSKSSEGSAVLVALKRDQGTVSDLLEKFQWTEHPEAPERADSEEVLQELKRCIEGLKLKQERARDEMREELSGQKEKLDTLWTNLRMHELYSTIQDYFSHTQRTTLFSGWIPSDGADALEQGIRTVCGDRCVVELSEAEQFPREKVPVKVESPTVLAPFTMLVDNYATPEYGSVNPTPFVAAAYLMMFGLMFGDAGQGLVIVLIGLLGGKGMKNASGGVKKLLQLFIYCGAASVVAGILFGSYFGYPLFPPLWFDYHGVVFGHHGEGMVQSVYDILKITIFFGIGVIGLGLVLNWINLIRKRRWFELLLDKAGLLGGWFYGCGVYSAFYFVAHAYKSLPPGSFLSIAFGIPVLLLLLKGPLHHYLSHRRKGAKGFSLFNLINFFMEWIVELLEIFSGYLANTLSFMRVAGLGIAHVSLMAAFDSIASMTGNGKSGAAGIAILLAGNILVIALEGLSAGVQALRLNYYEFFSKYFTGAGVAYNPVSLKRKD